MCSFQAVHEESLSLHCQSMRCGWERQACCKPNDSGQGGKQEHTSQHRWLHSRWTLFDTAAQQPCTCCGTPASHSAGAQCLQQCKTLKMGASHERENAWARAWRPAASATSMPAHPAPCDRPVGRATSAHLPKPHRCGAQQTRCLLGSAPSGQPGATKPDKITCCRSSCSQVRQL